MLDACKGNALRSAEAEAVLRDLVGGSSERSILEQRGSCRAIASNMSCLAQGLTRFLLSLVLLSMLPLLLSLLWWLLLLLLLLSLLLLLLLLLPLLLLLLL